MAMRVGCISLGCPKNLVDSEIMLGLLKPEYEITADITHAEVIIVNTCAFIKDAKEEAIDTILEAAALKNTGDLKILIVAGCLAQRYKGEIIREIPEVDAIIGTGCITEIESVIREHIGGEGKKRIYINDPEDVEYLNRMRLLQGGASQYLKIAEGCSNFCTYCIIPNLRGPFRSRAVKDIVKEAESLTNQGARELILIAQDVSRYGEDLNKEQNLVDLIRRLTDLNAVEWIRLLYCYPERISDTLIDEMKNNPKLLNYLDIPVQHASDRILKAMGRKSRQKDISALMRTLRTEIPDIILRTSVIAGFPGETEADFNTLVRFIQEHPFDRLGAFSYSREEGTPAALMKNQIKEEIKLERLNQLLDVQQGVALSRMQNRVGRISQVLVEGVADDGVFYYGRSYGEAPEIDPVIYFTSEEPLKGGTFVPVEIVTLHEMDMIGRVLTKKTVKGRGKRGEGS